MTAPNGWAMVVNNILFNLNIPTIAVITGLIANKARVAADNYINSNGVNRRASSPRRPPLPAHTRTRVLANETALVKGQDSHK